MSYSGKIKFWFNKNGIYLILLLIIILAAALLRFYDIGKESLWLDEASSLMESGMSISEMSVHSNQPPLYFLLLHWWTGLFGIGEAALRSFSAIFGIIAVIFVFLTGKELFDKKTGLIGAFIASISQFYIYYSQEVRSYSLLLLLSLVSFFLFIKLLKRDRAWFYPAYLLATALLCYTHIYGFFLLFSQIIYVVIFRERYKNRLVKFGLTIGGICLAIIPIVFLLGGKALNMAGQGFWIPSPGPGQLADTLVQYSAGFTIDSLAPRTGFDAFLGSLSDAGQYILTILLSLLAIAGLILHANQKTTAKAQFPRKKHPVEVNVPINRMTLLALWLLVTILLPFIASFFMTPFFLPRYTIGASPAFYLMAAYPIGLAGKKTLYAVLAVITIFCSISIYNYYVVDIKEQWKSAASYIQEKSSAMDAIIFCENYCQTPFDYYYHGGLPESGIKPDISDNGISSLVTEELRGKQRLWFVLSNVSKAPPPLTFLRNKYKLLEYTGYRGIIVYLFDLSAR